MTNNGTGSQGAAEDREPTSDEQPQLEINDASGHRTVAIDRLPFRVGRGAGNDLRLQSSEVSRLHAEIVAASDGYAIRDCGSRHGTFVNGEPVQEGRLDDGNQVRLGRKGAELTFRRATNKAAQPPARHDETVGDLRQVAALLEGLRGLSSARVLDDVLVLVMDSAIAVSGAERGFIMLANADGNLEFTMGRSRERATLPGHGFETSSKIPEEVFRTGKTRIEADLRDGNLADAHQGTVALGIRHVLCVPLRLVRYAHAAPDESGDQRIGVLYLDSHKKGTLLASSTGSSLETLANEAAVAIENAKLYREAVEKARLDQEMRTAAEMQQALLPTRRQTGAFFASAAETLPCRAIGGDFFDYVDLADGALGIMLGDVAGKGPPAALLSAFTQGSLQAHASASGSTGPASVLTAVNTVLVKRGIPARFVTLFYGVLTPGGHLTYCNAGHNPPMLVGTDGAVRRLEVGGMVLGLFEGVDFVEATVKLGPGDFLVVFSDGVSEAMNAAGEEYGDDRLIAGLAVTTAANAASRLHRILADVEQFTAGAAQHDDVTAMVVEYRPTAT